MYTSERSIISGVTRLLLCAVSLLVLNGCGERAEEAEAESHEEASSGYQGEAISYNSQVRPILSDRCYACHGPDAANQKSPFRLDSLEASRMNLAREGEAPRHGIVPGDPDASLVIQRIVSKDPSEQMPPPEAKKKRITEEELAILRQWIAEGANYEKHWAFVAPVKAEPPAVKDEAWVRNPIDRFILAKLESRNIKPSPEADRETLIRRVYMDLLGLPPEPGDIDEFLADTSDTAYEAMVKRVLASPHFGERAAIDWLDASRYGDSNAIHVDMMRTSWPWRDWVIRAFNGNMPYDQFIIEQLAGDLLPDATTDQKVATSFNRNHGITNEGGAIPDEFLVEYAVDRISTVGSAMMGLTVACARCHDHKFDPITMDDFYSMMSFFNNINEKGLESQSEFDAYAYRPFVYVYTKEEEQDRARADKILNEVKRLKQLGNTERPVLPADEKAVAWDALTLTGAASDKNKLPEILLIKKEKDLGNNANNRVTQSEDTRKVHFRTDIGDDAALTLSFKAPSGPFNAIRIEASPSADKGRGQRYNLDLSDSVVSEIEVELHDGKASRPLEISGGYASLDAEGNQFAAAVDKNPATSWNLGVANRDHHLFLQLKEPVTAAGGEVRVRMRYVGTQPLYKFYNDLVFYAGNNPHGYDEPIALIPEKERADWHKDALLANQCRKAGLTELAAEDVGWAHGLDEQLKKTATRCMVMEERADIKPTYVLDRGLYDKPLKDRPRERVTPAVFPPMAEDAPKNRLGFAQWMVSDEQPLTARVAVNRFWQQIFVNGIVRTSEDFGLQGENPTHPELLDYLAVDFRENGWDVKRLYTMLLSSATYRQSSRVREDLEEVDPQNKLLARSPRYRFPAEVIRDNALAASGLLVDKVGGPSVKPYQPPGLWREKTMRPDMNTGTFKRDSGEDLYRRGMYTFWKQASPPPQMELFDAPSREACVMKRRITTTPLQALVLMNDETWLEFSRELATRLFHEVNGTWDEQLSERLVRGLRLATGRKPSDEELQRWVQFTRDNLDMFAEKPGDAEGFLKYGEKPRDESIPVTELAALTYSMSAVFNLDETLTRD